MTEQNPISNVSAHGVIIGQLHGSAARQFHQIFRSPNSGIKLPPPIPVKLKFCVQTLNVPLTRKSPLISIGESLVLKMMGLKVTSVMGRIFSPSEDVSLLLK